MKLTNSELLIIEDREFHLTKAKAISKIYNLLSAPRSELKTIFEHSNLAFPAKSDFKTDKISRGENYMGQPYLMLDYPAIFSEANTFAFRTMFWWGNFFSATLHLQGASLEFYRNKIIENLTRLENQRVYISIGKTPWQYHYEPDNYELLTKDHAQFMEKCNFLKLSKKIELADWRELPSFSVGFFSQLSLVLARQC